MAGGRPAHFDNAEELKIEVDKYFESINGIEHPTVTGLALYLGFESRQSVYDYEKNGEFSYIIKRARLMVENGYEKELRSDKPTGAIFALKNMGWVDKQESTVTNLNVNIEPSPEEAKKIKDSFDKDF